MQKFESTMGHSVRVVSLVSLLLAQASCTMWLRVSSLGSESPSPIATPTPVPIPRAQPSDYGFTLPSPEPTLPANVDLFEPPLLSLAASAPQFTANIKTAARGEILATTGDQMTNSTKFEVFSQTSSNDFNLESITAVNVEAVSASLLIPATRPAATMYLIWPKNGDDRGKPIAVNRTETWWIGPSSAVASEKVSIYGRNLSKGQGEVTSFVYIKPSSGTGQFVTPTAVNPFKVEITTPALPVGSYEVWLHNGHGGRFGWSGPLTLNIAAQTPWANQENQIIDVTTFGANGGDTLDDTSAIEDAIDAAKAVAPSTLYFPAGTYRINDGIRMEPNVRWLGAGRDLSEIRLTQALPGPFPNAMIYGDSTNAQIEALTINGNKLLVESNAERLMRVSGDHFRIRNSRLNAWGTGYLEGQMNYLIIETSELIGAGAFLDSSHDFTINGNQILMTNDGGAAFTSWGGVRMSITNNDVKNADETQTDGFGIGRLFSAQRHFGSVRDGYWQGNVTHNFAPRDCNLVDCNQGEQISFDFCCSSIRHDFVSATTSTITFGTLTPITSGGGTYVMVLGGKGAGQYRKILSAASNVGALETPWTIIPDATSKLVVTPIATQMAIYKNSFEGRADYSARDTNSTAVYAHGNVNDIVFDSNVVTQMRHGMMNKASSSAEGMSPLFNLYSNNTVSNSNSGAHVGVIFNNNEETGVYGGLGISFRKNTFTDLAYIGIEFDIWDLLGSDYLGTVFDQNNFQNLPFGFINAYRVLLTYNGVFTPAPASSTRMIGTILHKNSFNRGTAPSAGSIGFLGDAYSTFINIDSTWTGFDTGNAGPN